MEVMITLTRALTFCIGEEYRECSMDELAWRMGLYNQFEAITEGFGLFLDHFHRKFPQGVNGANGWSTIAQGIYIPSAAQEGDIRSPIHRLIHRFISRSINMRKDDDKYPSLDLFYL